MIPAGKYKATIEGYAIKVSANGEPIATICFTVIDREGGPHSVYWSGMLREGKSAEITIAALLICGLKGNNPLHLAKGMGSGVLDESKEVQVTVEHETNPRDGKTHPRVKWVNETGGSKFKDAINEKEIMARFGNLNFGATVMELRHKNGYLEQAGPKPAKVETTSNYDEIPF